MSALDYVLEQSRRVVWAKDPLGTPDAARAELAALRAEVERLRNECIVVGGAHSAVHAERISLRAEVERLRGALRVVRALDEHSGQPPWWGYQEAGVRTFCIGCNSEDDHTADCPVPSVLAVMEGLP
jgi:hypothetical protein